MRLEGKRMLVAFQSSDKSAFVSGQACKIDSGITI